MRLLCSVLLSTMLAVVLPPAPASAQQDPIVDRNFNLDLYTGAALGSSRIISMGGTGVATAQGSAFVSANPAAPSVRSASSSNKWAFTGHADYMSPGQGRDFDNNDPRDSMNDVPNETLLLSFGGFVQYKNWAFGIAWRVLDRKVKPLGMDTVDTSFVTPQVVLARTFMDDQLAIGLGVRGLNATIESGGTKLVEFAGATLETGGVWMPKDNTFRVGAKISLPILDNDLKVNNCDPLNCAGYILPTKVLVPWEMSVGFAWRHGKTVWNRKFEDFRDERELTLTSDIVLIGGVNNGHGIEAFLLDKQLQPSGRRVNVSVRAGAEYEAIPGWLQVRGGSYWEPARFDDVSGRVHGTFGLVGRIWSFCVFGHHQRLTLTLTADVASKYLNGGISLGLW